MSSPYRYSPQDGARLRLILQGLGVLQIGGVEALGEPVVDVGEHRVCFILAFGIAQQSRKADDRAQLQRFCALPTRYFDRAPKPCLSCRQVEGVLLQHQLATRAMDLRLPPAFTMLLYEIQSFGDCPETLVNAVRFIARHGELGQTICAPNFRAYGGR